MKSDRQTEEAIPADELLELLEENVLIAKDQDFFPNMELDICVYDNRPDGTPENDVFWFMWANTIDDALSILFDLSNRGYEIFQSSANSGIISILVQPSTDHSTNIDLPVIELISSLFV